MKKIQIVTNDDDWEGLYIDGTLVAQDHQVSIHNLAAALDIEIEEIHVSYEYLGGEVSHLPEKFSKIPKKYFLN